LLCGGHPKWGVIHKFELRKGTPNRGRTSPICCTWLLDLLSYSFLRQADEATLILRQYGSAIRSAVPVRRARRDE